MKNKAVVIPLALLAYLGIMSCIGYDGYASGEFSALYYFGVIAVSLLVIILLHFSLKRRERLRREREDDIKRNSTN
ncbi:MAG: hypothetical protein IKV83_01155 [Muribaculaceae bacterium]|nr:hypothetical protein [Muribaculaceae bacterium]